MMLASTLACRCLKRGMVLGCSTNCAARVSAGKEHLAGGVVVANLMAM